MTNLSIAQAATLQPIDRIGAAAALQSTDFEALGRYKAKLTWDGVNRLTSQPATGKLILVTAITPTPHGEGKTTVTVGLSQGLRHIGRSAIPAVREPALGPIFGTKGGASGGGYSQVLPMEDINLFFTGDYPAIQAAHNLLSAAMDAHLNFGNALGIDVRRSTWPRTLDMNDRALRQIVVGLGGPGNGFTREDGFVITAASEVMAVLALSRSIEGIKQNLGDMMVGMNMRGEPVRCRELGVDGAMTVLLRDALRPNLVQTIEGGPAMVHCGPFANIAHGCSSVLATECALRMADFTITEAGFAADLGAQKFMSIVAPRLGKGPDAIVLVATVRAMKYHGGGDMTAGLVNLGRHIGHLKAYGVPVVVAINRFAEDDDASHAAIAQYVATQGAQAVVADPWNAGGAGCADLAAAIADATTTGATSIPIVDANAPFEDRLNAIVQKVYGGDGFALDDKAARRLEWAKKHGLDQLPICVAKSQYSLSDDPELGGSPTGFTVRVREIRPSLGAGFLVVVCGEILLMPGLGRDPAALHIDIDADGKITGLF